MSERFTINRSVEFEAGREYVWWTVRDRVTGYLKDCRSEEEAKAHVAELESRAAPNA